MSSVFFDSAARIIKQVFDWLQTSNQGKTSALIMDAFQSGIDKATGEGFKLVPGTSPLSVTVQGLGIPSAYEGIAYDNNSNRIFLSHLDSTLYNATNVSITTNDGLGNLISTPQSTGCVNIPLTPSSLNYLWIDYLATTDVTAFTLNEISDAKIFYKLTDGYNIRVTTVNTPPDSTSIFLGTIDLTSIPSGIIPSSAISQMGRVYFNLLANIVPITTALANRSDATVTYAPASTYVLETHIKAVGNGPVNATNPHGTSLTDLGVTALDTVVGHRQLEHGNAIIAGTPATPSPSTSAMAASINIVNPGSDYLTIFQLLSTEFAIVNGTAYNVTDIFGAIPVNANIFFSTLPSGVYNVYWDSIVKAFSSTTASIASDNTKLWLCTVTWTFVGTGPSDHNALSALIERRRIGSTTEKYQRWKTTARPPIPIAGEYGFNLDVNAPEFFDGVAWQSLTMPTGTVLDFAGAVAPVGFLMNDGSVVSQTTYANLFAVIGTAFNIGGEGAGNFRLPNKQRRTSVGAGGAATGVLGNTVGSVGGEETHVLTTPELASHSHTATVTDPGHHHPVLGGSGGTVNLTGASCRGFMGADTVQTYVNRAQADTGSLFLNDAATGVSVANSSTGSGTAHNNMQPSIVFNSIIKY
jgi:microcystin-dependent protein